MTKISIITCFILLFCNHLFGQKTDLLVLKNQDNITGEIKKLEHGILVFSTDDAGTLQVQWDKVSRLESYKLYEIENQDGEEFFGSLKRAEEAGKIAISPDTMNSFVVSVSEIIRITPIRMKFWNRLDGSISLGFNYTKASNIAQLNYNLSTSYRTRKISNEISLNGNTTYGILQEDEETDNAIREDFRNTFIRFLKKKWYAGATFAMQKNTELGLQRRLMLGLGGGNHLVQTNRQELGLLIGIVGLREWFSGEDPTMTNLEGLLNVSYSLFKYDRPKTNVSFSGNLFPGLTDWGRVRAEVNLSVQQEIINDFFFSLTFYESFDNKPGEDAAKNDWGIVTSLGYSW